VHDLELEGLLLVPLRVLQDVINVPDKYLDRQIYVVLEAALQVGDPSML
jgi:hypothetical protein